MDTSMPLRRYFTYLRYYDWILFFSAILLLSFGLSALYGIAKGFSPPDFLNFRKQIVFSIIGIGSLIAISFVNYNFFFSYARSLYILGGIFLLLVLVFGTTFRGTTGWLEISGFTIQPVEFAKFSLLIILAKMFSARSLEQKNLDFIIKTGIVTFIYFILIIFQPDFGSAMLLFFLWLGYLFFSNIDRKYIFLTLGIIAILGSMSWIFFFQDYQKQRITSFFHPTIDPLGSGYHVRQSMIAIGSGGFFGKGLGSGSQSQLKFIPASQTDFIFAVMSEELGFFGATVIVALYGTLLYRIISIGRKIHDNFASHFAIGVSILFFVQSIINIGMNIGIMPVTGIGLPFLSYGGSFLILSFLLLGIVQSIAIRTVKYKI